MAKVSSEAGTSFDPEVVNVLSRRYIELEKLAREQPVQAPPKLSTDIKVERGAAPDAGFAETDPLIGVAKPLGDHGAMIAIAQREMEALREIGKKLGNSIGREDIFSMLAARIRPIIPYDSIAVYMIKDKVLIPEFVTGQDFSLFSSLRIPLGEGLAGWVAQNSKEILNGNPSVEPGYLNDPSKDSSLRSALAVPLCAQSAVLGVLAIYRSKPSAFARDELELLQMIALNLGWAVEIRRGLDSISATSAGQASKATAGA